MESVTQVLELIRSGDAESAERLLPLVYGELRQLAASRLASEKPGQTLQATALVHEAYLRLVDQPNAQSWDSRGHFFAAAAESMRRILVESARRKSRVKHGGNHSRRDLSESIIVGDDDARIGEILDVHAALEKLERENAQAAELVKLRYFAGMTIPECAELMGFSPRKANQVWAYAKVWLMAEIDAPTA